ncbi:pentapeptide repeat-containing protein [Subtercola sp. PAMC28395]|uniref:pentapeptide repeat-containing protein n=1 Tax=Subtercola sp. PAMC28395 TaxID=2846775 RepID=UPI001C0DD7F4|nr:pentapeptide repeat-containing protein [Subtercola sp. PAMC28395]QWT23709.1 pentapeptide repeat-containing protein [Subtercola sp. PAMC28395]
MNGSARSRWAIGVAALVALLVCGFSILAVPAVSAQAFTSGTCVINRSVDGPVAGGSRCAGADLSGEHLAQSDFDGADLSGASLKNADVQASTFAGATLTGSDFTGARVVGADFTGAGIVPGHLDVDATDTSGAAASFDPALPAGLTLVGCGIAGEPVASGAIFPLGTTGVLCSFATSRANEVATAVITITVASPHTSAPPVPIFTQTASAAPAAPPTRGISGDTMTVLLVGAGAVVLLGIVGLIIRAVLARRALRKRPPGGRKSGRGAY